MMLLILAKTGGERGIRTPGTVPRTHAFQAGALSHSATSPLSALESKLILAYMSKDFIHFIIV